MLLFSTALLGVADEANADGPENDSITVCHLVYCASAEAHFHPEAVMTCPSGESNGDTCVDGVLTLFAESYRAVHQEPEQQEITIGAGYYRDVPLISFSPFVGECDYSDGYVPKYDGLGLPSYAGCAAYASVHAVTCIVGASVAKTTSMAVWRVDAGGEPGPALAPQVVPSIKAVCQPL